MVKRYTEAELKRALDMIEEGYTHSQVAKETNLNKSILAREMRKRKNDEAHQQIDEYYKNLQQEDYETFIRLGV